MLTLAKNLGITLNSNSEQDYYDWVVLTGRTNRNDEDNRDDFRELLTDEINTNYRERDIRAAVELSNPDLRRSNALEGVDTGDKARDGFLTALAVLIQKRGTRVSDTPNFYAWTDSRQTQELVFVSPVIRTLEWSEFAGTFADSDHVEQGFEAYAKTANGKLNGVFRFSGSLSEVLKEIL